MIRIDKAGLEQVVGEMPYAVSGYGVVKAGEEEGSLWKRRADGVPWFGVSGEDLKQWGFTSVDGERWLVWADLDEFAVSSSAWAWEIRYIPAVDYVGILETLNMSRVFLGHAFRYEEKSWLLLISTVMAKRIRTKASMVGRASIGRR